MLAERPFLTAGDVTAELYNVQFPQRAGTATRASDIGFAIEEEATVPERVCQVRVVFIGVAAYGRDQSHFPKTTRVLPGFAYR